MGGIAWSFLVVQGLTRRADVSPGAYLGCGYSTHLYCPILSGHCFGFHTFLFQLTEETFGTRVACVYSCLYGQLHGLLQMIGLLWVSDSQEIEIDLGFIGPFSKTSPGVNSAMNSNNPEIPGRRKVTSCRVRPALEDPTVNGSGLAEWFGSLSLLKPWLLTPPI